MDYKYINQLLERYWNAETTLEEEEILRAFFSQVDIPAELERYRPLFVYEQTQPKTDVLDEDFDERMLAMIEEPTTKVKARTITMKQRLMPLFKAAAIVAIILTLGNAMQVPFSQQNGYEGTMAATQTGEQGVSVAIGGDSLTVDSMQQSVLQAPAVLQEPLAPTTSD
jgi:hypothetical protein